MQLIDLNFFINIIYCYLFLEIANGDVAENFWKKKQSNISTSGEKIYYDCKFKKSGCQASMYLLIEDETKGKIFISDNEHTGHEELENLAIANEVKEKITELEALRTMPEAMLSHLLKVGLKPPKKTQLNNFLRKVRKNKLSVHGSTLNDLKTWCLENQNIPEDDDTVFVGGFEIEALPSQLFRVFLTTKRLITLTLKNQHILADATYKLICENFPVLTAGTTDKAKHFHPFGLAITKNERDSDFSFLFKCIKETCLRVLNKEPKFEYLVADNAGAITNGTENIFDIVGRVNCWAHTIRNIDFQLRSVDQQYRENLRNDISKIQLIFEEKSFDTAISLFTSKWKGFKNHSVNNFIQYFSRQWCSLPNKGWFEGFALGVPSTSNALESFHQRIKQTIRGKRHCLIEFLNECQKTLIHDWSVCRSPSIKIFDLASNSEKQIENENCKFFYDEVIYSTEEVLEAHRWNQLNKTIQHFGDFYFTIDGQKKDLTRNDCKEFMSKLDDNTWSNFDEMMLSIQLMIRIKMNKQNWKASQCTCYSWLKNYKCKHIVATACRLSKNFK